MIKIILMKKKPTNNLIKVKMYFKLEKLHKNLKKKMTEKFASYVKTKLQEPTNAQDVINMFTLSVEKVIRTVRASGKISLANCV